MSPLSIRPAVSADVPELIAFNIALAAETEGKALDVERLEAGVRSVLADPRKGRYFLATRGAEVVGQLMHSYEYSDWRDGEIWWLQSVYVAKAHRRRGVLAALLASLRAEAEESPGVIGLRLYVEQQNAPAQASYARLGFSDGYYRVMELMFDAPSADAP